MNCAKTTIIIVIIIPRSANITKTSPLSSANTRALLPPPARADLQLQPLVTREESGPRVFFHDEDAPPVSCEDFFCIRYMLLVLTSSTVSCDLCARCIQSTRCCTANACMQRTHLSSRYTVPYEDHS